MQSTRHDVTIKKCRCMLDVIIVLHIRHLRCVCYSLVQLMHMLLKLVMKPFPLNGHENNVLVSSAHTLIFMLNLPRHA